jgi:hypothetical protein
MAVAAAIVVTGLAGCAPDSPTPDRSPSATATPVFASDAEALTAAEAAYAAYLKVSDEIAHDGGANPERLSEVATGQIEKDDLAGFQEFRKNGWHSSGASQLKSARLQFIDSRGGVASAQAVSVYLCEDISGVDVLDDLGNSVVSTSRPAYQSFQVAFNLVAGVLIPSDREPWPDSSLCD